MVRQLVIAQIFNKEKEKNSRLMDLPRQHGGDASALLPNWRIDLRKVLY